MDYSPLGPIKKTVPARLETFKRDGLAAKIWAKDPSAWNQQKNPAAVASIKSRLGWLESVALMRSKAAEMKAFAKELSDSGIRNALLLGMGGSSLAPELFSLTFGAKPGALKLSVLDSTDPASVREAEAAFDPKTTVLIVSSKSGGTIEVSSFYKYFAARAPGSSFIAITDPGTALEKLAQDAGFRKIFLNPPDIGGRYSALSYFGMLPAALLGIDVDALLASAASMAEACGPQSEPEANPGLVLGAAMGEAAVTGRDKLTLLCSPELSAFGSWIEQLVAESTGKEGRGILPVDGEPAGEPSSYGRDRLFVYSRLAGSKDTALDAKAEVLSKAGLPVLRLDLKDLHELGGEFFRWEFATAVAGAAFHINPFDEPNVKESKDLTAEALAVFQKSGALPEPKTLAQGDGLTLSADAGLGAPSSMKTGLDAHFARLKAGDYIALLAYLHPTEELRKELEALRAGLRRRFKAAATLGFGPRFLHSTGQLHKGGPNNGVFLQLTCDDGGELAIPGESYGFSTLKNAQALGDFKALELHRRRVARVRLGKDALAGLKALAILLETVPLGVL